MGTFNYQGACMAPWSDDFDLVTKKIMELYARNGQRISAGNLVPAIVSAHGASLVTIRDVSPLAKRNMEIRPAAEADVPAVLEIFNREVVEGVNAFDTEPVEDAAQQDWFECHRDPRFPLLVAVEAGSVIGWASLSPWARHGAYLRTAELSVFIHAQHRGRRVGRTLLRRLVDEARAQGHHVLIARVEASNGASCRLHLSEGFSEVGVMPEVGWKHGRYLNVAIFQRIL